MKPKIYRTTTGQVVSAQAFLKISSSSGNHNIKSVKFEPPRVGGKGFGGFRVEYRHPVLQPVEDAVG